jgi:ribosome biogenesis GTPase
MHHLPDGGWLIDTPGMRELQLLEVADALENVFAEITELAESCRFSDCTHSGEPGCAVLAAIAQGELDAARLKRFQKLLAEDRHNTATVAERRTRDKHFGKMIKKILAEKQREKGNK